MNKVMDVMIDLETLATTADAVIMSIGAVRFDPVSRRIDDAGFYASISIDSNLEHGRRVSESTMIWWMQQPQEAQKVFFEPKQTLTEALEAFAQWFGAGCTDDSMVWSNGADFDIPMLAHAFTQLRMEVPWAPFNARCVRTLKNLPGAHAVPRPRAGVKHNALDDAINQARHVQALFEFLKEGKVTA